MFFDSRTSVSFNRRSYSAPAVPPPPTPNVPAVGSSATDAVAVQAPLAGHAARLRPSTGAICALPTTWVAFRRAPGRSLKVPLTVKSHFSGYTTRNLIWVPAPSHQLDVIWQKVSFRGYPA